MPETPAQRLQIIRWTRRLIDCNETTRANWIRKTLIPPSFADHPLRRVTLYRHLVPKGFFNLPASHLSAPCDHGGPESSPTWVFPDTYRGEVETRNHDGNQQHRKYDIAIKVSGLWDQPAYAWRKRHAQKL